VTAGVVIIDYTPVGLDRVRVANAYQADSFIFPPGVGSAPLGNWFFCTTLLPGLAFAANVMVKVTSYLFPEAGTARGMPMSLYDIQNGKANLPARFVESAMSNTNPGVFSWKPQVTYGDTTNLFALEVVDNGSPSLSATESFKVLINSLTHPSLSAIRLRNGLIGFQINNDAGPDYAAQVSTNLIDWIVHFITKSPAMKLNWRNTYPAAIPMQFFASKPDHHSPKFLFQIASLQFAPVI
jgi:hypothetical protein